MNYTNILRILASCWILAGSSSLQAGSALLFFSSDRQDDSPKHSFNSIIKESKPGFKLILKNKFTEEKTPIWTDLKTWGYYTIGGDYSHIVGLDVDFNKGHEQGETGYFTALGIKASDAASLNLGVRREDNDDVFVNEGYLKLLYSLPVGGGKLKSWHQVAYGSPEDDGADSYYEYEHEVGILKKNTIYFWNKAKLKVGKPATGSISTRFGVPLDVGKGSLTPFMSTKHGVTEGETKLKNKALNIGYMFKF